jgi:HEAT repeat protein
VTAVDRAARIAALGVARTRWPAGTQAELVAHLADPDARVRAAALGALVRRGTNRARLAAWSRAIADPDPAVRRRAAELAPVCAPDPVPPDVRVDALLSALHDADPLVAETAAWALGELGAERAVDSLATTAREHRDPLVREAAVAALGALGDPRGLPAILAATHDKPAIRRRAVLALAPFESPDVDAALERALTDRDWQVRQAAEDLL